MDHFAAFEQRDELPWLEGTVLAAMRTWVLGRKRGVSADQAVQGIFANLRATEAIAPLDQLMHALNQGCTRMIEVYCTCEPVLSADEALLLDALALTQEGRHDAATSLLQRFVEPATAHAASGHGLAVIQALRDAGHVIARGPAALRRYGKYGDDPLPAIAALTRLH